MSSLLEEQMINTTITSFFTPIYPNKYLRESPFHTHIHETSDSLDNTKIIKTTFNYTEPFSSMVTKLPTGDDEVTHLEKKRKTMHCKVERQGKRKKEKKSDGVISKNGGEKKLKAERKDTKKAPEEAPSGYVRVRARRGQATDSHSLAERVRREKISERMRLLQSLVPGCDKITGKALILDEIINYVQSLQNQVEFLVMKLASVDPLFNELDTNTPAFEKLCNLETPLPSLPQPDSIQIRTNVTETMPISTSFLLQQDDGDLFGGMDDQSQKLANHYGFSYLCSF